MTHPENIPTAPRVAVVGLGRMGAAVAARLAERGHTVVAWSRSGRRVPGTEPATSPAAAAATADVVLLCLFDGPACREVVAALGGGLAPATVVVNTSTVSPQEAEWLAAEVEAAGAAYLHAPVLGSVGAVAAGALTVLAGGPCHGATRTVVDQLGEVLDCRDAAGAATAKLLANGVLADGLLALRESRFRAAELGIDPAVAWAVLERTVLGGLVHAKRRRLAEQDFGDADFTVGALAKDLALLAEGSLAAVGLRDRVMTPLGSRAARPDDDVAALCAVPGPQPDRHGLVVAPLVTAGPDVLAPLRAYVAGHATGNPDHHRRAFLPTAHVEGFRDGRFVSWSVDDYCSLFGGAPAADELRRRRQVDDVRVSGTVATASMTLWHGADVFTDAFVLLCVDGEWRIANKAYHRAPADRRP